MRPRDGALGEGVAMRPTSTASQRSSQSEQRVPGEGAAFVKFAKVCCALEQVLLLLLLEVHHGGLAVNEPNRAGFEAMGDVHGGKLREWGGGGGAKLMYR